LILKNILILGKYATAPWEIGKFALDCRICFKMPSSAIKWLGNRQNWEFDNLFASYSPCGGSHADQPAGLLLTEL